MSHSPFAGKILVGDVRKMLDELPSESVDCIVSSPPYFRLRNYGEGRQIGLERHVDEWVDELRLVARGLRRVLKEGGSFWLNLGDTYSRSPLDGALAKSLVLAPERLATALVADGWVLRNKVIWSKPNPMPAVVHLGGRLLLREGPALPLRPRCNQGAASQQECNQPAAHSASG